jgi:hypothetical protein
MPSIATLEDVVAAINDLEDTTITKLDIISDNLALIATLLQISGAVRPAVSILVQEFFNRQDLDSGGGSGDTVTDFPPPNNSIYGTVGGFQLNPSDPEFPILLESVHEHPRFENPLIKITLAQYFATLS